MGSGVHHHKGTILYVQGEDSMHQTSRTSSIPESASELQAMVKALDRACTQWGTTINAAKTRTMTFNKEDEDQPRIILKGSSLEAVRSFSYLGSQVGRSGTVDGDVEPDWRKLLGCTRRGERRCSKAKVSARKPSCMSSD